MSATEYSAQLKPGCWRAEVQPDLVKITGQRLKVVATCLRLEGCGLIKSFARPDSDFSNNGFEDSSRSASDKALFLRSLWTQEGTCHLVRFL